MPIAPSYQWEETDDTIEIVIKLPGATRRKSDVSATECMVKVNLAPYLLVLDLHGEVDATRTVATFEANESVKFRLHKQQRGVWGRLEADGTKEQLAQRRIASIERAHALEEQARKQRLERKQQEERAAVDRQIELEKKKRAEIEKRKHAELTAERDSITSWQQGLANSGSTTAELASSGKDESDYESDIDEQEGSNNDHKAEEKAMPDHPHYHGKGWWPSMEPQSNKEDCMGSDEDEDTLQTQNNAAKSSHISSPAERPDSQSQPEAGQASSCPGGDVGRHKGRSDEDTWRPMPPPRMHVGAVKVEFTQLEMPHLPAREQREEELKVYKKTQATRDPALIADSNDISERQPLFLRDKGAAMFAQGNYRSAVAVFSRAIQLDSTIPMLWSNRAAAYAKLSEHEAVVEDCSQALDLLRPRLSRYESGSMDDIEGPALKKQLVKCLVRRGASWAAQGRLQDALKDYEEAAKYESGNIQLTQDIEELKASLQQPEPDTLRARGAARFSAGDFEGAVNAFTCLLNMSDTALPATERMAALSNRAAALLGKGDYSAAYNDCCQALCILLRLLCATSCEPSIDDAPSIAEPSNNEPVATVQAASEAASAAWSGNNSPAPTSADSVVTRAANAKLQAWIESLSQTGTTLPANLLGSLARLLARRGAVCGHLRLYSAAVADFKSGAALLRCTGADDKAAALQQDAERMQTLLEQEQ